MKNYFKIIIIICTFTWAISSGPLKDYRKSIISKEAPQLILILGGDIRREYAGIEIGKAMNLPIIISGGSNPEYAKWMIKKSGLSSKQVTLDYRAKDTLSNFTSLIDELKAKQINHILLITTKDHMQRAKAIGRVVAGSRGIYLSGISIPCSPNCLEETKNKEIIDFIRSIAWVFTGKDLKNLSINL